MPKGYDHKYIFTNIGYNLKMTDIQASIGVAQMGKVDSFIKDRKRNYRKLFNSIQGSRRFIYPIIKTKAHPSWFGFPIICKRDERSKIISELEHNGIVTRMLFGGNLIRQPAYKDIMYYISGSMENTDFLTERMFWIGVYPGLNDEQIEYMTKILRGLA
jgi:CDP-6-deoxy-D-xylo-4-hexulose-3-dehydrase